jgi:hypothetical protein
MARRDICIILDVMENAVMKKRAQQSNYAKETIYSYNT